MRLLAPLWAAMLVAACAVVTPPPDPLAGKTIVIDPGHGGTAATDSYRVGPAGEREEWVNLRVGLLLRDLLEARGARVLMTRTGDVPVELRARAQLALDASADAFVSVHHNATADPAVNFPIIYFHGNASENQAGVALAQALGCELAARLYAEPPPVSIVSDHVIFPTGGTAVLRRTYGIPGVIGEASFFTHPAEEQRLRDPAHNRAEAEAYAAALEAFFAQPPLPIRPRGAVATVTPFEVFQESERMRPEAQQWRENFEVGRQLVALSGLEAVERGLSLLLLSARTFPDSPVARECHLAMAEALDKLGRPDEAAMERLRVREHHAAANPDPR